MFPLPEYTRHPINTSMTILSSKIQDKTVDGTFDFIWSSSCYMLISDGDLVVFRYYIIYDGSVKSIITVLTIISLRSLPFYLFTLVWSWPSLCIYTLPSVSIVPWKKFVTLSVQMSVCTCPILLGHRCLLLI